MILNCEADFTLMGVLHRIVQQVDQYLTDPDIITVQLIRQIFIYVDRKLLLSDKWR